MRTVMRLLRSRLLGVTFATALIGRLSAGLDPSLRLVSVLVVAVLFHIASYVLNDVADVEIDRANPNRVQSPLVAKDVGLRTALFFGVTAVAMAFAVDRVGCGAFGWHTLVLAVAFAGLIGYDFAGKRVPFAPLTDAIQGVGWGALAWYGALTAGTPPSRASFVVVGFIMVVVTFVNGVHGALRDVASDFRSKANTTAILLGARPDAAGPVVSKALLAYAWAFHGALIAVIVTGVVWTGPRGSAGWSAGTTAIALIAIASFPLHLMLSQGDPFWRKLMGGAHIVATFGAVASLAAIRTGPLPALCVLGVLVLPLLPASWRRTATMTRLQFTEAAN